MPDRLVPDGEEIICQAAAGDQQALPLFDRAIAIVGTGFYVWPEGPCSIRGVLTFSCEGENYSEKFQYERLTVERWAKIGSLKEITLSSSIDKVVVADLKLNFEVATSYPVNIFGAMLGPIVKGEFSDPELWAGLEQPLEMDDVYTAFYVKTAIYVPELLYLRPDEDRVPIKYDRANRVDAALALVLKSCNRCSRFLPIDCENERNTLSFSNHCVTKAPCTHSAFSTYSLQGGNTLPGRVAERYSDYGQITTHYGYQLECKVCKKFFVNLPLNPLRNSTQHREDSLRRRALEVLVAELLGNDWVYHEHRIQTNTEFDVEVWEKFGKQCFNCQCDLPSPSDMDLDHTMPLAYLWPLDSTATCLCPSCNSSKSDKFPVNFYSKRQLADLSEITGIRLEDLTSRKINQDVVDQLLDRIEWFFDSFLRNPDYQKRRDGKLTANNIVHALQKVLGDSGNPSDLVALYSEKYGRDPTTVDLQGL